MNVRKIALTMLGSVVSFAAFSGHIAATNVDVVMPLTEWFISRPTFAVLMCAATFVIGLIIISADRRGSRLAAITEVFTGPIAALYAGAAGGVFGWILGICVIGVVSSAVPIVVWSYIVFLAAVELSAPLVGIIISHQIVSQYNNTLNRDPRRAANALPFGFMLLAAAPVIAAMYQ